MLNMSVEEFDHLYASFDPKKLMPHEFKAWSNGTFCLSPEETNFDLGASIPDLTDEWIHQTPHSVWFCPMPFQPERFSVCCSNHEGDIRCCDKKFAVTASDELKWLAFIVLAFFVIGLIIALCSKYRHRAASTYQTMPSSPSTMLSGGKYAVTSIDKKVIVQTDKMTIQQILDGQQFILHFNDADFYARVKQSVVARYAMDTEREAGPAAGRPSRPSFLSSCRRHKKPDRQGLHANWDQRDEPCDQGEEGDANGSLVQLMIGGEDDRVTTLTVDDQRKTMTVAGDGAMSWVMRDMQAIYRNIAAVHMSVNTTMVENYIGLAWSNGDGVLASGVTGCNTSTQVQERQSEIEVKFKEDAHLINFKSAIQCRYPDVVWSRYLQRDCTWITLDSGARVSIHTWQGVRSFWITGDGGPEWYASPEFRQICTEATADPLVDLTNETEPATGGVDLGPEVHQSHT